ncbi:hypothetical protein [[Clostridium] polysaccharolyticum]|uniref:Uncharacterized protein n=1 Tax=[Clostridium] polysaccharolyticum TaxID=29364 RepID=A0A1H9YJU5_9FIRM|nr:hypothetical protein [[Clostridium] polysaccharolyticum]SES69349.1 hypothetical protein SAMN04487772_10258 [[Clostridium] polysaccharolyticum]
MKRTAIAVKDIKEGQIISFDRKTKSVMPYTYGTVVKITENTIYFKRGSSEFGIRKN